MSQARGVSGGLVITLTCPDRTGIVRAVAGALAAHGWSIDDAQQFADPSSGRFMRVEAPGPPSAAPRRSPRGARGARRGLRDDPRAATATRCRGCSSSSRGSATA